MLIFRKAVDRLADMLRRDRKVTYRAFLDARTASYVTPLLDKIVADDADGDTIRNALIPWKRAQRPPIAIYHGDISRCRIDGPWQVADEQWLPLGGLIVTSGVNAHLNPFEAQALQKRMQQAIEDVTLAWVREHDLYALRHVPEEIDRSIADPAAKAMIAAWAFLGSARPTPCRTQAQTRRAIAAPANPVTACAPFAGKDWDMPDMVAATAMLRGCDATHRASNSDTHLTHGCIQHFCGFDRMRIASRQTGGHENSTIPPFRAIANSISPGAAS